MKTKSLLSVHITLIHLNGSDSWGKKTEYKFLIYRKIRRICPDEVSAYIGYHYDFVLLLVKRDRCIFQSDWNWFVTIYSSLLSII